MPHRSLLSASARTALFVNERLKLTRHQHLKVTHLCGSKARGRAAFI